MKKVYKHEQCIVHVVINDNSRENILRSTEKFLRKVLKEKQNDNVIK